jgi:hypothetical protein
MNTYITNSLKRIKAILVSGEQLSAESIDSTIGELEMMKMEIEQHITNMPQEKEYKNIRCSAEYTIEKLSLILDLLEEFSYDKNLVCEIVELIEEISY